MSQTKQQLKDNFIALFSKHEGSTLTWNDLKTDEEKNKELKLLLTDMKQQHPSEIEVVDSIILELSS